MGPDGKRKTRNGAGDNYQALEGAGQAGGGAVTFGGIGATATILF